MTTLRQLTFMTTTTGVILSIVIVAVAAGLSVYSWRRSGYRRAHGFQELLRVMIIAIIAVLFNQPEWIEEYRPEQRPTVAVLYDSSVSMQTLDVIPDVPSSRTAISRADSIEPITEPKFWEALRERLDVIIEPLGGNAGNPNSNGSDSADNLATENPAADKDVDALMTQRTNLHAGLAGLPERLDSLLGVVLISDGDWNDGPPPVDAATRLRLKGIPVYTVPVGSATRLPDVELVNVDLPTFGIAGKDVRIPFTIDSSLPREFMTTVTMTTSTGETLTKYVRVAASGRTSDSILWKPLENGDYTVTLDVAANADETIANNNSLTAPIAIRSEQLKVLIVESYPRWEYRYLRNALSRDPGVEVSCLLFHPGLSKPGGGSTDYIKEFPSAIEDLATYDVVFLGDVGVEPGQLTLEDCRLLKGLVEQQASGLIFMPGWQGRQHSLFDSELEGLYPVTLDPVQIEGWGSRTPAQLELTERGRRSLLTRLSDTDEQNVQVWETLPGFQWYAAVTRAKAGTQTLAVHADMSNEYGRLPLLVTRTYGAGKVLFMGTDGAWRWRKGVEDLYHYRFWGQVIRWMAYQRNMAKGETMRLFYSPEQPEVEQTVAMNAHVMAGNGEPLSEGDVIARITAPSGQTESVRFIAQGNEWGVFQAPFVPSEAGEHQVVLACKQTGTQLKTRIFVQGQLIEQVGKPARPDVLQEIARTTNARMVQASQLQEVMQSLSQLPMPPLSIRRLQLWNHPAVAAFVIFLLAGFWVWRKAIGLI